MRQQFALLSARAWITRLVAGCSLSHQREAGKQANKKILLSDGAFIDCRQKILYS